MVALRALAPVHTQPHVVAAYAFGAFSDDVCDRGPCEERAPRFDAWVRLVEAALAGGPVPHPLLAAYLHTMAVREQPRRWVDAYLAAARADIGFAGFATEDDYQAYVENLSLPFLMVTAGVLHPGGGGDAYVSAIRALADGCQRTDILADLAADLACGRLYLPTDALARHSVERHDVLRGQSAPGLGTVIAEAVDQARTALAAAQISVALVAEDCRPLQRAVLLLHHHRLTSIAALGAAVARTPVRDSFADCLRLLVAARGRGLHGPGAGFRSDERHTTVTLGERP
ncbi:squalene/phytoene synthase family protein [Streptomyces sp. NBC_01477]|uniref:squalene/phytoene synthase family protein n=1 Tax=Streptomyces sp. NBC_01477 TaxID=2976015 RepID=UPI002E30D4E5|nr:squalene/phytoene synthase family protein [Streptomyces sp. NBC_01477]